MDGAEAQRDRAHLDPLSEEDSETLVERLGDLPEETRERIVEAAEGNPLFVEQLVAMRAEGGDGELEVPPTLQALLAARIDQLRESERAVVERGSVEGRLFHRGAVAALLSEPERPAVGTHLLTLVRKELIRPDRATLPGDDGFRFGHILIRDAAYDAIPKRQRAALHERYVDWLVSKLGDDVADEIVGYHLEQAYRYRMELGSPDPALGARASERLAAAARAARFRGDVPAQVNLWGRATDLVPAGAARPLLLVRLGWALEEGGELARAREVVEEAVALAREAGDGQAEWLGRIALADIRGNQEPEGASEDMLREAEAAVAAGEAARNHEVLAQGAGSSQPTLTASVGAWASTRGRSTARCPTHVGQAIYNWRPGSCSPRRRTSSGAPGPWRRGCASWTPSPSRWDTFQACKLSRSTSVRTCERGSASSTGPSRT